GGPSAIAGANQRGNGNDVASRTAHRNVLDVLHVQTIFRAEAHPNIELIAAFAIDPCLCAADAGLHRLGYLVDRNAELSHASSVELHALLRAALELTDVDPHNAWDLLNALLNLLGYARRCIHVITTQLDLHRVFAARPEDAVQNIQTGLCPHPNLRSRYAIFH